MCDLFGVAYMYAKAVFDLSVEQNNINHWKKVLKLFSIISQDNLIQSLCFRFLEPNRLSNIFISICEDYENGKLSILNRNFVYIMAENHRILLCPKILDQFNILYCNYMNVVTIKVISANKLNINHIRQIYKVLEINLSKKVSLEFSINKKILSGIMIYIGDTVIDGSLSGRILRLNKALQVE